MHTRPSSSIRGGLTRVVLVFGAVGITAALLVLWSSASDGRGLLPILALSVALGLTWGAFVLGWRALSGLRTLEATARAIAAGDLAARSGPDVGPVVGEVAEAVDGMAERFARMWADREALLAAVSHELRSPLQRLAFGVELLSGADGDEAEERLREVQDDIAELDTMVGDLLLWARIDRQTVMREPLVLAEVLDDLVSKAARLRPQVRVRMEAPPDLVLLADPRHVPRAWANLLHNAVRYAASTVEVRVRHRDGQVELWVDDDGPGVPPDQAERIFEPFVRLDAARSRDAGGVGLGLALARRTARAHEGALWVERSSRGGARFIYRQEIGGRTATSAS